MQILRNAKFAGANFAYGLIFGYLGAILGLSWAYLGTTLGYLGAILGLCWAFRGLLYPYFLTSRSQSGFKKLVFRGCEMLVFGIPPPWLFPELLLEQA